MSCLEQQSDTNRLTQDCQLWDDATCERWQYVFCSFLARQPPVGQVLVIHEVSRSHSDTDTAHAVRLLWTCDQLVAETST